MLNSLKSVFSVNHKHANRNFAKARICRTELLEERALLTVVPAGGDSLDDIPALVAEVQEPEILLMDFSDEQSSEALQGVGTESLNGTSSSSNGIDTYTVYTPDRGTDHHGYGQPITLVFDIGREFDTTKEATLILRVHDVDYAQGEWDTIEINNQITLAQPLTGANNSWSMPEFKFSSKYLKVGQNTITIHPSVKDHSWVVACEYGKLSVTHKESLSIESVKLKDLSGNRKTFERLGEKNVEDAFIKERTSILTTLKMDESCNSKNDAINAISSITLHIDKKNDDGSYTEIEKITLNQSKIRKYTSSADSWNSSTHTLIINKNDWEPKEEAFGNIRITCTVATKKKGENDITKIQEGLRIGVTEYDVSFGRAVVDATTGGVKQLNGEDIEHSFDRDISTINFTKFKMERKYYDTFFLNETDKSKQWKSLVNFLVDKKLVSIEGYDAVKNAVTEEYAKKTGADQMKMLESLLKLFSDYHFYVLLGKETGNKYATKADKKTIKNPKSDIMRTIYVPSLTDSESYSNDDANVDIMARMFAYEDWHKLGKNETRPGSLIIYTKWSEASGLIKGGGEIILTPYVVAFAKETINDFQGYGLMNAMYSSGNCMDNFFISRGTGAIPDFVTDLRNEGVGYFQYQNAKTDVLNWISSLKNKSVTLTGHSLGGALTQWFASGCAEQDIINKIKKITTFNSAAISATAADNFNSRDNGIDIDHYVSNGDIVSFAGEKFIGKGNIVHLITYRLEYTNKEGKSVDQRGRLVDENGYVYKKNNDGSLEKTEEYGDFGLGYKHGMWLANTDWRGEFSSTTKEIPLILKQKDINKIQYITLGNLTISINTLNSYWFHWTQTGYLGPSDSTATPLERDSFIRGTTEQVRKAFPIWMTSPNTFTGFDANNNKKRDRNEWWLTDIHASRLIDTLLEIGFYNQTKYTVAEIKNKIKQDNYAGLTISSGTTYGTAELTTLSRMKLPVVLAYQYAAEQAPSSEQNCLLNGIYVKKAPRGTQFGVSGIKTLFTLAEETSFTFTSSTGYNAKMNNDTVELKAGVLKLNSYDRVTVAGKNYSEKKSGSSMDLTSLVFAIGVGDVSNISANVSGKKMYFDFIGSDTKATANADLTVTLKSQDVLSLTNAKIVFRNSGNEVTATSGTFNGQAIKSVKLKQFVTNAGLGWIVSEIVSSDGRAYKYINGQWVLPAKKQDISLDFGFQSSSPAPAMALAVYAPEAMAAPAATVDTRVLAFNWTNPVENPNLVFKVGNTVYTESEMISNGNLLLYTKSDTSRSYIIRNSSANVNAWRFNSNENLGLVQVALQTFEGDITPAQVTSVNTVVSNGSKVNITFTAENMTKDSLIEMAIRQTGQTEDTLDFYVPVSEMTQTSGGYGYTFDLADYDLTTGDYQIFAWSDESMRKNAVVSGSFHVTIQRHLVLSQTSLQFANTNAMKESSAKQLTITNTGNGKSYFTLSLANSEEITGADFSISGTYSNGEEIALDCIGLAAGESVTLDIQFTPQSEGAKSWTVELLDADTSEKCGEFTISGTGLAMLKTEVTILADNSSLTTTNIAAGDPLYVSGTLKNTGNNVSDAITVSLYASQNSNALSSGVLLGSYEGIILEGQSEIEIPFYINSTLDLSVGNWYLGFVVDCSNDTITSNNSSVFSNRLSVTPSSYDSVVQNVSTTPNDLNNNGFYDTLKVSGTINVETAGKYIIVWSLWDNDSDEITEVSQEYTLRAGANTVTANFDGNDIFRHGINGPYTISASVTSDTWGWYKPDVFVTSAYNVKQFEGGQLTVIDSFTDYGKDTDSNGKYDKLSIGFRCKSSVSGNYTIQGTLRNANGMTFEATSTIYLSANVNQNLALDFDLNEILQFENGSYFDLETLTITENSTEKELVKLNNVYRTTGNYTSSNVDLPNVMFTGNFTTVGSDENNDGLYETLNLRIGVKVTQSGYYLINGLLVNENSEPFYNFSQECYLDSNSSFAEIPVDGLMLSDGNLIILLRF